MLVQNDLVLSWQSRSRRSYLLLMAPKTDNAKAEIKKQKPTKNSSIFIGGEQQTMWVSSQEFLKNHIENSCKVQAKITSIKTISGWRYTHHSHLKLVS